ncbi:hypothetical protein [Methylotuvimicrobium buryatense]|nr:hypothetical protein [Methylotuvimicrobium buryatense]
MEFAIFAKDNLLSIGRITFDAGAILLEDTTDDFARETLLL